MKISLLIPNNIKKLTFLKKQKALFNNTRKATIKNIRRLRILDIRMTIKITTN